MRRYLNWTTISLVLSLIKTITDIVRHWDQIEETYEALVGRDGDNVDKREAATQEVVKKTALNKGKARIAIDILGERRKQDNYPDYFELGL